MGVVRDTEGPARCSTLSGPPRTVVGVSGRCSLIILGPGRGQWWWRWAFPRAVGGAALGAGGGLVGQRVAAGIRGPVTGAGSGLARHRARRVAWAAVRCYRGVRPLLAPGAGDPDGGRRAGTAVSSTLPRTDSAGAMGARRSRGGSGSYSSPPVPCGSSSEGSVVPGSHTCGRASGAASMVVARSAGDAVAAGRRRSVRGWVRARAAA